MQFPPVKPQWEGVGTLSPSLSCYIGQIQMFSIASVSRSCLMSHAPHCQLLGFSRTLCNFPKRATSSFTCRSSLSLVCLFRAPFLYLYPHRVPLTPYLPASFSSRKHTLTTCLPRLGQESFSGVSHHLQSTVIAQVPLSPWHPVRADNPCRSGGDRTMAPHPPETCTAPKRR